MLRIIDSCYDYCHTYAGIIRGVLKVVIITLPASGAVVRADCSDSALVRGWHKYCTSLPCE
jgi:hypothetical protein